MATQQPTFPYPFAGFMPWGSFLDKTADYTIVTGDNGTCFSNAGATGSVTFTLPALQQNYRFCFKILAEQTVVIQTKAADNTKLVAQNQLAGTSLTFNIPAGRVGATVVVTSNQLGTLWYAEVLGPGAYQVA